MSKSDDEFNAIVRKLWRVVVVENLSDPEAIEVVGRLLMAVEMARCGGDPRAAATELRADGAAMAAALVDDTTRVLAVIVAKDGEDAPPPARRSRN